jgi:hypothetical protein
MSSRVQSDNREPRHHPAAPAGRFDKAFPVYLEGDAGIAKGVGRNISESGIFVETREPFPLGSRVRVTFTAPGSGVEMVLEGEVRFQCFINYAREDAVRAGMRGIGLKFVEARTAEIGRGGSLQ